MSAVRFGIDVGGTFTDVVARDEASGQLTSLKVPTVPEQQEQGVLEGIAQLRGGQRQVDSIVHGTTVVTNAILEGRIAKVALVTTRGFRDVLEIGRQNRASLYDLERPGKPEPLVPRRRRFEVDERIGFDGRVLRALDEAEMRAVVERVRGSGAEAVAVSLLHAYADPAHERALKEALAAAVPYVCTSSEVNAEFREYERTSTAVLNAAVMPLVDRYLEGLRGALAARGIRAPLHIVQSSGGMMSDAVARRLPVRMVMSGPAAGVAAARYVARQLDPSASRSTSSGQGSAPAPSPSLRSGSGQALPNVVAFDMGGTSTDVCLIAGGQLETVRERKLDGRPLRMPAVAVESIGAGGGSVAWLDPTGALKVGPRSAGAAPGPACYGQGGTEPTVTDANVVLGYIRPGGLFGGTIRIEPELAEQAVGRLARALGLGLLEAARGIVQIADATMLRALRLVSVQRGYDLRSFALIAYGGAGPLHAGRLAGELRIPWVVVPADSSVFSAFGCLVSDLRYDAVQTYRASLSGLDLDDLEARFRRLEAEATAPLLAEGYCRGKITPWRSMDLRYSGQNYELEVPVGNGAGGLRPETITADFNALHRARYTYSTDEDIGCLNLRVVAVVASAVSAAGGRPASDHRPRPIDEQRAMFPEVGSVVVPIYRRAEVGAQAVLGPAIVEDQHSTIVVFPNQRAGADQFGNLHLEAAR